MRFSLMTEPQLGGTYDQLLELARWAHDQGMVSFARSDHWYSGRDPQPEATDAFATLAGLARETVGIRLCVLVSPITFRHPAVIAKNAATIDQMSGGRLDLGVGTGWMEREHDVFGLAFPEWSERFERLSETLPYLRAAFGPGRSRYEGNHYSLDGDVTPKPTGVRIVVGGTGPTKTPMLAGTFADEYNHLIARPEVIAPKIEVLRRAAERAGRDPAAIECTVMGQVFAAPNRREFVDRVAREASARDLSPEELEERWHKAGVPAGTPDEVGSALHMFEEIGVTRFYLQWLDVSDRVGLEMTYDALAA
jgi:alkanesulfonate monooxygenase SsuD/methylene tetrahydromethanopterin reductase-like flavin-dependent oxidoreductase (luciferase family)